MAILVTGGAGFVGSHLVDRLVAEGEHVIVVDDLSTGRLTNLERALSSGNATFLYLDVAQPFEELQRAIASATRERLSEIYHLASPASPVAYGERPWATLAVNGVGTMSVVEVALEHGALLLFTSTSEVYGDPLVHPQPETYFGNVNPIGPRACYDEGKRFGEAVVSVAMRERGLDGRIVRIFNCYGPRMELGDGRLVPALLEAARDGRPFPIQGSGLQTRSMTYVDDLIDGVLAVAAAPLERALPVNLGSEEERTVIEIARVVADVVERPFEVEYVPARPEDPRQRKPDAALARSLGWQARTTLRDGIAQTYAWLARETHLYA